MPKPERYAMIVFTPYGARRRLGQPGPERVGVVASRDAVCGQLLGEPLQPDDRVAAPAGCRRHLGRAQDRGRAKAGVHEPVRDTSAAEEDGRDLLVAQL
jgi:hypothetical protein